MMTTLYLLRHGATRANLARPYWLQGQGRDEPLIPQGIRQAEQARDQLSQRPITAVYSSPMLRAAATAHIIAAPHELEVQLRDQLKEGDVGRWEGRTWEEIQSSEPEAFKAFHDDPGQHGYPGGENFRQVAERVVPLIKQIIHDHPSQQVVIVSHQIVTRVFIGYLLELPARRVRQIKLANGGISVVSCTAEKMQLVTLNAALHLEDALE